MDNYTQEELEEALQVISSIISRCEKAQIKFKEGTSQHSLLKNRLRAMYLSRSLLIGKPEEYTSEDLTEALRPVVSIISKCEKAQLKFPASTSHYRRFENIIKAMYTAKASIQREIARQRTHKKG